MSNAMRKRREASARKKANASKSKMSLWFQNVPNTIPRLMMKYLRKRGYVAFYLNERARTCARGTCWMKLYQAEIKKEGRQ